MLKFSTCRSLATLGDRSFHVAAPKKLWNSLPKVTKNIFNIDSFKKAIKTFLFSKTFN